MVGIYSNCCVDRTTWVSVTWVSQTNSDVSRTQKRCMRKHSTPKMKIIHIDFISFLTSSGMIKYASQVFQSFLSLYFSGVKDELDRLQRRYRELVKLKTKLESENNISG